MFPRRLKRPQRKAAMAGGHTCHRKADYLLSVKDNQPNTRNEIEEYVQDQDLRSEKNRERVEKRTAYVENDITWMQGREKWANLACIGAIHTEFDIKKGKTSEWHYYISSRTLTVGELLRHDWFCSVGDSERQFSEDVQIPLYISTFLPSTRQSSSRK